MRNRIFVLLCVTFISIRASDPTRTLQLCVSQLSCKACLEASAHCAWCSDWSYTNSSTSRSRCSSQERLRDFGCPEGAIKKPRSGSVVYEKDEDFQDVTTGQTPVQLKPQRVRVRLRPHSSQNVTVRYRPAKNYPLDLYYLMDLTWSMKDDKETLVGLGSKIASTLGTYTNNFRLGFGSYADKPLMPFIFPGHEDNPCKSEQATCSPLYSFKHRVPLTEDVQQFINEVNTSDVTGNVDNLEGGLDGVVQAIVCADEIGWTQQARKLMLLATDGLLHFAGEGKLGGVVERPDFQCHLNHLGEYSMAKRFDYPSLAEVSRLLQAKKVNLIFAVTEDRRKEYEVIADLLEEKARVATLAENSSNILEIVKSSYHEIVTRVVLRDNSSGSFSIRYYSKCGRSKSPEVETPECDGLEEGKIYDFQLVFSLDECPRNESLWRQRVVIDDALASETSDLEVEVELLCGCDCYDKDSSHCRNGVNECGICKCHRGWSGETCDCEQNSLTENSERCFAPGSSYICSNRGECICGKCSCDSGYHGAFCECSPCDKVDGVECAGRGTCNCGTCECLEGWEGPGCQCPSGNSLCIAPGSSDVCDTHGFCECGQCRCNVKDTNGVFYRGTYCEASASAGGSGLCLLYSACVNATVNDPTRSEELCQTNMTLYRTEEVESVDAESEHYCIIREVQTPTVCIIPYVYYFNKDNTVTLKIGKKICRTPMHAAFLPGLLFASIVVVGVLGLIIWKCWTAIKDKREYEKFELERKKTVYALDENPLYKPATTRFLVPASAKED